MKRLFFGKLILILGIIILATGVSYTTTYYTDDMYEDINLKVTFEDTKEVSVNLEKLSKEEALETYPYIFEVENKGKRDVNYQIKIKDLEIENIEKDELNYILLFEDNEVKSGVLSELNDYIIYDYIIPNGKINVYKLYIYSTTQKDEGSYKYSIEILTV